MLDLSIIILTCNEDVHIVRWSEKVALITNVVSHADCYPTDKAKDIEYEMGAMVVESKWYGTQAEQFNRASDTEKVVA